VRACGGQNKASNDYCESCGAPLGIKCDACNHINGPTSRFADNAARRWRRGVESRSILAAHPAVVEQQGGERKSLTVLFADIRNSTSLIDSLGDPELACGAWSRCSRS